MYEHMTVEMAQEVTLRNMASYYKAADAGYWKLLGGARHYGFTPDGFRGKFDMTEAQLRMESLLGEALGLPSGSKVLDAGCGYGFVAQHLAQQFEYDVTGVDYLHWSLKAGAEINRSARAAQADYHVLPFPKDHFDGVYTMETGVHAYDLGKMLAEFYRVLKPGGVLVMFEYSIPPLESVPPIVRELAERVIRNDGMASLPLFTHGSFQKILGDAGFVNVTTENIDKNVWPSWYHLWTEALKTVWGGLIKRSLSLDGIPGSVYIWPARYWLGYNNCRGYKANQ